MKAGSWNYFAERRRLSAGINSMQHVRRNMPYSEVPKKGSRCAQGRWSKEETARLRELVAQLPGRWTEIGLRLGRLPEGVRDKVPDLLLAAVLLCTCTPCTFHFPNL